MPTDMPERTDAAPPSETPLAPPLRGADWLRGALSRARERADEPSGELAAAVRVYIRHLREDGVTPERALVCLKTMLEEAFEELGPTSPLRQLADRTVAEAIAAYYTEE